MIRDRVCACLRDAHARPEWADADVVAAARDECVHLLLGHRLHLLDDDLRGAAIVEAARARELRAVLRRLAHRGIRPILFKGAALAYSHYPRPELRPRTDTDVMIAAADRESVAATLGGLGYERPAETNGVLATNQLHFERRDRAGLLYAWDVHWRVSGPLAFAGVLSYDELARDAAALPALGPDAFGPSPPHALAIACVHRVAHHADGDNLLWLFDIHLLANRFDARERAAFSSFASARRIRAVSARGLALAEAAFGGTDAGWIAELSRDGGVEPGAEFLGGRLRQVDVLKADLAAIPRWPARWRLLREHLFPSAAFMYGRYGMRQRLALPFLYLHRMVSGAPKWFRR